MTFSKNLNPQLEDVISSAIIEALRNTHTVLIAKVTSVNKTTINCQPVISRVVNNEVIDLPEFVDVPVLTLLGGGSSIQMPISENDYCILFVSERCFDTWYEGSDFSAPNVSRMHDYSDSIALVGLKNMDGELDLVKTIKIIGDMEHEGNTKHTGDMEHEGKTKRTGDVEHEGNTKRTGKLTQTGDTDITGNLQVNGNLNISGNVSVSGRITCSSLIIGGTNFSTHVHGNGNNGAPTTAPM